MKSITIDFTDDELRGLLVSAVEGPYTVTWAEAMPGTYMSPRGCITLRDRLADGVWVQVDLTTIQLGLQRAASAQPDRGGWAFTRFMEDRIGDALIADAIVQFAVLGDLKYA